MTGLAIRTGLGVADDIAVVVDADGNKAPVHVLANADALPYGPGRPVFITPAVIAIDFTPLTGTVVTKNATLLDIVADPTRKAGTVTAGPSNAGIITVQVKNAAGVPLIRRLYAGDAMGLTVGGGVLQGEILISGDTLGDTVSAETFH